MTARPILFSSRMVKAILEGKKTQTRRVLRQTKVLPSPYGLRDDELWVKETYALNCPPTEGASRVLYMADYTPYPSNVKWTPSIFMPRKLSRIRLIVRDVRVERLQNITDHDIVAEGVPDRSSFILLWDKINKDKGFAWDANPYVWVVVFKIKSIELCYSE